MGIHLRPNMAQPQKHHRTRWTQMGWVSILWPQDKGIQLWGHDQVFGRGSFWLCSLVARMCPQPNWCWPNPRTMEKDLRCHEEKLLDSLLRLSLSRFCQWRSRKGCLAHQILHFWRIPNDCRSIICQKYRSLRRKNRCSSRCQRMQNYPGKGPFTNQVLD